MLKNELKQKDLDSISKELSEYVSNKHIFRKDQVKIHKEETFLNTDWSSKNMRRIYFSLCNFNGIYFKSVGFTGSIFKDCIFNGGNLDNAIFDECIFSNCTFINYKMNGTSFCNAEFSNCKFDHLEFDVCSFSNAVFKGMCIDTCKIVNIIWERAKFNNCIFKDTKLEKLNFEFTFFNNVTFDNTDLPFASIPYIFGGIEYIKNTKDEFKIKTVHPKYLNGQMSKEQYLDLLPDMQFFYKNTFNYFPYANILLGLDNLEEGKKAILDGLKFWILLYNFKLMYYLCDLANIYNFSIEDRKIIYNEIEALSEHIYKQDEWEIQKRWDEYKLMIRTCLLNSPNIPSFRIEFITSIGSNDYTSLLELIQGIDETLLPQDSYHSVELRHNSPFELIYTIYSTEQNLIDLAVKAIAVFGVCNQVYNNIKNNKLNRRHNILMEGQQNEVQKKEAKLKEVANSSVTNVTYTFNNCTFESDHFIRQSRGCVNLESSGKSQ